MSTHLVSRPQGGSILQQIRHRQHSTQVGRIKGRRRFSLPVTTFLPPVGAIGSQTMEDVTYYVTLGIPESAGPANK